MTSLNPRLIFALLSAVVILTRPQLAGSHLPNATTAAFFICGMALASRRALLGLLALVIGLHSASALHAGRPLPCMTPAYAALPLGYAALWQAGRLLRGRMSGPVSTLSTGSALFLVGGCLSFLATSGAYYLFSGKFPEPTWVEFAARVERYLPGQLLAAAPYVAIALAFESVRGASSAQKAQS